MVTQSCRLWQRLGLQGALVGIWAIAAGAALAQSTPIPDPSSPMAISSIEAFQGVVDDDDLLVLAVYEIAYPSASIPAISARDAVIPMIIDADEEIGGAGRIAPFRENGYNFGVLSVYIADSPFPPGAELTLRLQGNPTIFDAPPPRSDVRVSMFSSKAQITNYVRRQAAFLQDTWGITMLDPISNEQLTVEALGYFKDAIPGLTTIAPGLSLISSVNPQFGTPIPAPTGFAQQSAERHQNVYWLGGAFNEWSSSTGLPAPALKGLVFLFAVVLFVTVAAMQLGSGGAMGALAVSFAAGLPIALSQGFAPWGVSVLILVGVVSLAAVRLMKGAV